jgi:ribosomal protein L28
MQRANCISPTGITTTEAAQVCLEPATGDVERSIQEDFMQKKTTRRKPPPDAIRQDLKGPPSRGCRQTGDRTSLSLTAHTTEAIRTGVRPQGGRTVSPTTEERRRPATPAVHKHSLKKKKGQSTAVKTAPAVLRIDTNRGSRRTTEAIRT